MSSTRDNTRVLKYLVSRERENIAFLRDEHVRLNNVKQQTKDISTTTSVELKYANFE